MGGAIKTALGVAKKSINVGVGDDLTGSLGESWRLVFESFLHSCEFYDVVRLTDVEKEVEKNFGE